MGIFNLGAPFNVRTYAAQANVPGLGPNGELITIGGQVSAIDERQRAATIGLDGDLRIAFAFEGPYRTTAPYQIIGRPDGNFLALYDSPIFGPPTPVLLLHGADGAPIAAPISLTDVPAAYQRIHIQVLADNSFVVLLSTGFAGSPGPDLRLMRFDAAGAQLGAPTVIEIGGPQFFEWSGGVAVASDGTIAFGHTREVIIHVSDNNFTFSEYGASVSLVTPGGQRTQINLHTPGYIELPSGANSSVNDASNTYPPQIVALDTGGFAVIYQVNMGSFGNRVPTKFTAFVDGAGNIIAGPAQLFTDDTNGEFRVEALPGGKVAVAWVENTTDVVLGVVSLGDGGALVFERAVVGRTINNALDSGLRDLIVAADGSVFVTFDDPVTRLPTTQRVVIGDDLGRVLTGRDIDQSMTGTDRDDWFDAEGGNDTIDGGAGNDRAHGGAGDDVIIGGPGSDTLDGGNGFDTADYSASPGAVTVHLGTGVGRGGHAEGDRLFGIERIVGSAAGDHLTGGTGSDVLEGRGGNDTLYGGGSGTNQLFGDDGNDLIFAGSGGDFIGGGAGNDTIRGAEGSDTIYGGLGNDNIGGGAGNDQIFGAAGANVIWGGLGNDTVQGGTGSDTIYGGGDGRNELYGNDGDDVIEGGFGGDLIGGGAGNDRIFGIAGANTIWGGLGNDTVQGGSGNDTIYGGGSGTNQVFGNDGNDLIFAGDGGDFIGGGAGNDTVRGAAGNDTIYGGLGNDDLAGGAGHDLIFGSVGANTIWGGLGNDTIHAGTGRDVMTGGPGADTFVFASAAHIGIGAGRDVIADFTNGEDRINLTALNTQFTGTSGFSGGGQASFYYFAPTGLLIGDQDGNGVADWVLQLTGAPGIVAGDFLL